MKIRKLFAGMTAAALAASMMAISASAKTLYDSVQPGEDSPIYAVGAMGFYMSQIWDWHGGDSDWVSIDADTGLIEIDYHVSPAFTFAGNQTLGAMGIMVGNVDPEWFPIEVNVLECTWTPEDEEGNVIGDAQTIDSLMGMQTFDKPDPTGTGGNDFRFYMRPGADDANGFAATPEFAGFDAEGSFTGGTIHMKIDFMNPAAGGEDSTGGDSQGEDSTGGDSQGEDSTGGDSQGEDSTGGDSQGEESTGGDSQGEESTGGDSQGEDSTGGDSQSGEDDGKQAVTGGDGGDSNTGSNNNTTTTGGSSNNTTTTGGSTNNTTTTGGNNNTTTGNNTTNPANGSGDNNGTGAAEGIALALAAVGLTAAVVSKKRK